MTAGATGPPPPVEPPTVVVHFDGACQTRGGRRVAAWGFTVEGAGLDHEEFGLAVPPGHPRATNNVAEYAAAICALEWLVRHGYAGAVHAVGDSELVVRQMLGEYRVLHPGLAPYHERLRQLTRQFRSVGFEQVPRAENSRADALSKRGLRLGEANGAPSGPLPPPEETP